MELIYSYNHNFNSLKDEYINNVMKLYIGKDDLLKKIFIEFMKVQLDFDDYLEYFKNIIYHSDNILISYLQDILYKYDSLDKNRLCLCHLLDKDMKFCIISKFFTNNQQNTFIKIIFNIKQNCHISYIEMSWLINNYKDTKC